MSVFPLVGTPLEWPSSPTTLHWLNVDHCHLPAEGERVLVRMVGNKTEMATMEKYGFVNERGWHCENVTHYAYVHGPDNVRLT